MKFRFILIFIVLLFPFKSLSQQSNLSDSTVLNLQSNIEAQNSQLKKLDSTIIHLINENAHLKELAEKDIDHAKSLINSTETIVEFIAVLLAIFTVIGGIVITKMFRQSNKISKDHKVLLEDWEKTRQEIDELKEVSLKEGRELLQILFYITEGDNNIDDRPEEAIRNYHEALKIRGNNPEVYSKLGRAYLKLGDFNNSISILEKGNSISAKNTSILNNLARVYRKIHKFDIAEKIYKKILKINENDYWPLIGLGHIYTQKLDFDNAEIYYKKAVQNDNSITSFSCLAFLNSCQDNKKDSYYLPEKALTLIEEKLSKSPESSWLKIWKAVILIAHYKYDQANDLFIKLKKENLSATQRIFIFDRLDVLYSMRKDEKIKKLLSLFED